MTVARPRRTAPSAPRQIGANDNRRLVANDDRPPPKLIMLGDLPVVSLRSIDELSPGEAARIGRIEAAQRGRKHREASRLALEFEASLGITTEERCAALAPANDMDRAVDLALGYVISRYAETYTPPPPPKKAKRQKGVKKPKAPKVDPLDGLIPGDLTQDEIERLEKHEASLKSTDATVRGKARDEILKIQRAARRRAEQAAVTQAHGEIAELERLRGNKVVLPTGENGSISVPGRDGLETLRATMTRNQRAALLRYRADYEQLDPERRLTPPELGREGKVVRGGEGWDDKRLEIERRIWTIHLMIAGVSYNLADPDAHAAMPALPVSHRARRAIYALEEIAGKGCNLSDLTQSGSVRFRLSQALLRAADCAAIVYGLD